MFIYVFLEEWNLNCHIFFDNCQILKPDDTCPILIFIKVLTTIKSVLTSVKFKQLSNFNQIFKSKQDCSQILTAVKVSQNLNLPFRVDGHLSDVIKCLNFIHLCLHESIL